MKVRKYLKYNLYMLFLITCMFFLSGCHGKYPITVTISNGNMNDKKIDILIPMDKYSPDYTESAYTGENVIKENNPEIAVYKVDGYRSMLCHYRLSDYKMEKTDDSTYTAELYLNGKYEFKQLCDNYTNFKIAVLDNDGNILKVSEECSFSLQKNVILDKIEYDYITNTVTPEYTYNRSLTLFLVEFLISLLIMVMPIPSLICFIVLILQKLKGTLEFPTIYHNIMFMIYIIPTVIFIGIRTDYALKTQSPLYSVWEDFLNLGNVSYCLIPVVIFLIVMIWWFVSLFSKSDDSACNSSGDDV